MNVFDVREKRAKWKQLIRTDLIDRLVFLDESGVNTNLTRRYGRSQSNQRVVDHAPLNTPKITTVLSSVRFNGEKAFTMYSGGTTGVRFLDYLDQVLIPTLHRNDIVVMDNLRSHRIKEVEEHLRQHHIRALYLPPYSPDLNPIEKMWSKMKAILRKWKVRSQEELQDAIINALNLISVKDIQSWFMGCF